MTLKNQDQISSIERKFAGMYASFLSMNFPFNNNADEHLIQFTEWKSIVDQFASIQQSFTLYKNANMYQSELKKLIDMVDQVNQDVTFYGLKYGLTSYSLTFTLEYTVSPNVHK